MSREAHVRICGRRRVRVPPSTRQPYGDAGPVVVVGVTPHQGVRESRAQGQGGQVIGHPKTMRYA